MNNAMNYENDDVFEYKSALHEAAIKYAEQGMPVFPLWPNSKQPLTAHGFKDATTDIDVINGWWASNPDANIGISTGKISGLFVVDVDVKNGAIGEESIAALLEKYGDLPPTRVHTTPSGGYHLLYKYPGKEVRGSSGKLGSGLDVRCDGGYIVVPPSSIDGKYYVIRNDDAQIVDAPEWLVTLALEKPKTATTSGNVAEGQRNDHIFNIALKLKQQNIPKAEALEAVTKINNEFSSPLDDREVQKTLESAYRYDTSPIPPEIDDLNKKHAFVVLGGKSRVLNEVICPIFNRSDISLSTTTDFRERYSNQKCNGMKLGQYWLEHPHRRQYDGIVFAPGKETPLYYNLWRGFGVEPVVGDCSLYLKHIEENICNGNKEIYNYVISWMADSVQNLDRLIGTAIVLKGKQGTGKGRFVTEFGKLFGPHFTHISQSSHLTGKFNAHLKHTYILFADEACWGGDKQAEGPLKALITEPTLLIEAKGQDPITMKNHVHVLVSSNNDWVVPCGPEERRFLVLEVGDKHQQDKQYFKAIEHQMNNGGREALLFFLMNYDLNGIDLRTFPKTDALFEMKMLGASPVKKFWYEKLMAGALDSELDDWNNGTILCSRLQDDYRIFANNADIKHKGTDSDLGKQLRKLVPEEHDIKSRLMVYGKRQQVYNFPSLQNCREYFETMIGHKIDWPKDSVALKVEDNQ